MSDDLKLRINALDGYSKSSAGCAIGIEEKPLTGMVTLRAADLSLIPSDSFHEITGCDIPAPLKFTSSPTHMVLWMSTDELMILSDYDSANKLVCSLNNIVDKNSKRLCYCVNVSDARSIFSLTGNLCREVFAKGSPLDYNREKFSVGCMRRTRIAAVSVAIYQIEENPDMFEVFCYRSYARYLFDWLCTHSRKNTFPLVISQ